LVEYGAVGLIAGVASGFFGIGGGTVVVPLLLLLGEPIKFAIGLSAMQMTFSSFYGTWLNSRSGMIAPGEFWQLGVGGVLGAAAGAWLLDVVNPVTVGWIFSIMMAFALIKTILSSPTPAAKARPNGWIFLLIGLSIGVFSGLVGVGGGFLLVPVLVGLLGLPLKNAVAIGLYFVMFVGTAAFVTLAVLGYVDFIKGALLAGGALVGVYLGILLANRTSAKGHKGLVVALYVILLGVILQKLIRGEV
jgi:uncharacterized membrane protein YfcA